MSTLSLADILTSRIFLVCSICGNKRCPHATDHRLTCTGSNEPGQIGSSYGVPLSEAEIVARVRFRSPPSA
jgi:hypothetical protein